MPEILSIDPTPNENAMKFTINGKAIASGSATFKKDTAANNPIAEAVFKNPGVVAVFLLNDFVTVTKEPGAGWNDLLDPVSDSIRSVG